MSFLLLEIPSKSFLFSLLEVEDLLSFSEIVWVSESTDKGANRFPSETDKETVRFPSKTDPGINWFASETDEEIMRFASETDPGINRFLSATDKGEIPDSFFWRLKNFSLNLLKFYD